ncbi:MAG TPA: transposase [Solirubrobacterales bacterium]|jgi:transposase|nr:transposase [Solirubrobacterales bacterium]HEX6014051.1 transposase [Geminicoccaceae bacterium]
MDRHTDTRQVQRLEVIETGRRRRWTPEAKLRIVAESFAAPRLASATARRHGISGSLLFAWRKAFREGRLTDEVPGGFAPAVLLAEAAAPAPAPAAPGGRIEIVTRGGHRVLVDGAVDAGALARVLDVLERR